MKVSLNHVRSLSKAYGLADVIVPDDAEALVSKIGAQLGGVEEVQAIGKRYEGVIVVRVVSCEAHPNADRLHVCTVDDGHRVEHVERNEKGYVQVVCGAPNVRAGMLAAWLPPGATVPSTYDSDAFVLEARNLRGVVSNGMMASPHELALGDNHDGILEIDDDAILPGTYFADAFDVRNDIVIDIENKMFTHRPDCFGIMGVAREIAGIQGQPFKSPAWYDHSAKEAGVSEGDLRVEVRNELPQLVPRFVAIPMSGVTVCPSPAWLQVGLSRLGLRPINNIVDLTNYYMVLTGQPLHAYDYDKLRAQDVGSDHVTITVRHPNQNEQLELLNGKIIVPKQDAIMIATKDTAVGLGGVMGGANTEVDEHTKNIVIECANFDMYSIRRTSMAQGLFTDAVTRFNKGQSPLQNMAVALQIARDVADICGGRIAGPVVDDNHLTAEVVERGSLYPPVRLSQEFINSRLGFDLSPDAIAQLLRNTEFTVTVTGSELVVTAPFWRTDIAQAEDIVEEVGRLYGFDHLPQELPKRSIMPAPKDGLLALKASIRGALSSAGANEVLTYSFVHGALLDKVGQNKDTAFQLSNALSPDLQYYRLSLTPSLLERVHPNVKAGYETFALFELNKVHDKSDVAADGLPNERDVLALTVVGTSMQRFGKQVLQVEEVVRSGAAFYQAKHYMTFLAAHFGIELDYQPCTNDMLGQTARPFDPARSAIVTVRGTKSVLGIVGEYRGAVKQALKLPQVCAGFELNLAVLQEVSTPGTAYQVLSRFPKVEQDICLRVSANIPYQELAGFVDGQLTQHRPEKTRHSLSPVDIYQRPEDVDNKQVTLRVSIVSFERTLTDGEVNTILDAVAAAAHEKYGAERV